MKHNIKLYSVSLAIILCIPNLRAKCNNPADLDRTFGPQNNGTVIFNFPGSNKSNGDGGIVIDDQGRIVVSGTDDDNKLVAVARLLPNGLFDNSFGTNGKVTINFTGNDDKGRGGVVRDSQGRLIVAGYDNDNDNYLVARLLENGSLDTSFGTGGKVIGTFGDIGRITGVKLNKEGKIVLFGDTTGMSGDLVVIQLNINGLLDTFFGDLGRKLINQGGTESTEADFIIDTQGRIVVAGHTDTTNDFVIARLNADGSFDTTFGNNGISIIDIAGEDLAEGGIALTRSGKIIVCGTANENLIAFQLNNDGSLDTSFGTNGSTSINLSTEDKGEGGITIDSWGNIYLYGTREDEGGKEDFIILARLKPNGLLDTIFGNNGTTLIGPNFDSSFQQGGGITIDAQGRIVLLGVINDEEDTDPIGFVVVRLCGDQLPAFVTALREKYRANCSVLP